MRLRRYDGPDWNQRKGRRGQGNHPSREGPGATVILVTRAVPAAPSTPTRQLSFLYKTTPPPFCDGASGG